MTALPTPPAPPATSTEPQESLVPVLLRILIPATAVLLLSQCMIFWVPFFYEFPVERRGRCSYSYTRQHHHHPVAAMRKAGGGARDQGPRRRKAWLYRQPWPPSNAVTRVLPANKPVEEETCSSYAPERYYPAFVGQILNERYQLVAKLGWGSGSTAWLGRDLDGWRWTRDKFVAVKVKTAHHMLARDMHEVHMQEKISLGDDNHPGKKHVRQMLDVFTVTGPHHAHICIVFEAMREPLWTFTTKFPRRALPIAVVKKIITKILLGLDYLHTQCKMIHGDIKPDNIMVEAEDQTIFEYTAKREHTDPMPQKVCDGRTIYITRTMGRRHQFDVKDFGIQITDFDQAIMAVEGGLHYFLIQPEVYRAPEVILESGFTYSVDIWSLGVMMWDLIEGHKLFETVDPHKKDVRSLSHLGHMTALFGPCPPQMQKKAKQRYRYFKPDGSLDNDYYIPHDFTFESTVVHLRGEEKTRFIEFAKRMVCWEPSKRATARELLEDPWLTTTIPW